MSDREEWGPWIEHDGKGCPVPDGVWCHRVFDGPARGSDPTVHGACEDVSPVESEWEAHAWNWTKGWVRIVRYRTLRPRALQQLREMIETLPAPRQKEDAHV